MSNVIPVDPAEPSKKTSEVLGPTDGERTVQMADLDQKCYWNDVEYEQGTRIEANGECYECSFGRWIPAD